MPVVELFIGAVVGALGKTLVDYFWTTDCWQRQTVRRYLTTTDPIELKPNESIPFDEITDIIYRRMANVDYGIFVLAAPAGSGKSTFIRMTLPKLREKFDYIKLIRDSSNFFGKNLQESLCIPRCCALSEYLPPKTLIIVDQLDAQVKTLSSEVKAYITGLAADSVNSRKFKMIVCVSHLETAKEILTCNGGEKVQELCRRDALIWSYAQLDTFMDVKLPQWSAETKEKVRTLAHSCGNSPGFIVKASTFAGEGGCDISEENWRALVKYAKVRARAWREFRTHDEKATEDDLTDLMTSNTTTSLDGV